MEECAEKDYYKAEIDRLIDLTDDIDTLDLAYKILLASLKN